MNIDWSLKETATGREAAVQKARALAYLVQTDWYVTRWTETAEKIPKGITDKRAEARETMNRTD